MVTREPTDASVSDADLVRIAQQRDAAGQLAFESLVDRHQHWLVRLIVHLLGNQSDAEDVAQETFVRAFIALEECTRPEGFRAWLRVIARRLAFNHRRDARTRARYHESAGEMSDGAAVPPSGAVEGREALDRVLGELPYAYREIIVLRFVEELPVRELAVVLEIGESAAKMRLSRARAQFERCYQGMAGATGGNDA